MNVNLYKNYYIKSDAYCFILYQLRETKKENSKTENYENVIGYYSTIESALNALCNNELRSCKCTTLSGLSKELKRLRKVLIEICKEIGIANIVKSAIKEAEEAEEKENSKKKTKSKQKNNKG